jgi:hypothetical protein
LAVPVIVTVFVVGAAEFEFELEFEPQLPMATMAKSARLHRKTRDDSTFRDLIVYKTIAASKTSKARPTAASGRFGTRNGLMFVDEAFPGVKIVRIDVALEVGVVVVEGVTAIGENRHVAPAGKPDEHERPTG